jgi:hypothetical protein
VVTVSTITQIETFSESVSHGSSVCGFEHVAIKLALGYPTIDAARRLDLRAIEAIVYERKDLSRRDPELHFVVSAISIATWSSIWADLSLYSHLQLPRHASILMSHPHDRKQKYDDPDLDFNTRR